MQMMGRYGNFGPGKVWADRLDRNRGTEDAPSRGRAMPSRVARWTMPYVAVALTFFILAQAMMVGGWGLPTAPLQRPTLLVTVHLLTIGWLTTLMFAALRQFVPVITAGRPKGDALAPVALGLLVVGLVLMAGGFLDLASPAPFGTLPLLPVGGSCVIVGAVMLALVVASMLWDASSLALAARFVAVGLAGLILTVALGLTMALALNQPQIFGGRLLAVVLTQGLQYHLALGLIAWFTLTAMGVGYKLMAMFTLAPEERGVLGNAAFVLVVAGIAVLLATGLVMPFIGSSASAHRLLEASGRVAWLVTLAGGATYLADMALLYRQRRRRTLELNASFAAWAFAAFGASIVLRAVALGLGIMARVEGALAYLFFFGWLSGLALTQLYKIVPFLTWIERFGPLLGKKRVPSVQDLVDEPRARPWFTVYFVSVGVGTACGVAGLPGVWRLSSLGTLVATLGIAYHLWQARHPPGDVEPRTPGVALLFDHTGGDRPPAARTHGEWRQR